MNRRKFLAWAGGWIPLLSCSAFLVAATPIWIQRHREVVIRALGPGESRTVIMPFSAEAGDYAEVSSNADAFGLVISSEIDEAGNVVITIYNPHPEPVSASLQFTVRLQKM